MKGSASIRSQTKSCDRRFRVHVVIDRIQNKAVFESNEKLLYILFVMLYNAIRMDMDVLWVIFDPFRAGAGGPLPAAAAAGASPGELWSSLENEGGNSHIIYYNHISFYIGFLDVLYRFYICCI